MSRVDLGSKEEDGDLVHTWVTLPLLSPFFQIFGFCSHFCFSLGLILYEIFSGKLPQFNPTTMTTTLPAQFSVRSPPLSNRALSQHQQGVIALAVVFGTCLCFFHRFLIKTQFFLCWIGTNLVFFS